MKREFLKSLGIADELIDQIMQENGKDINNAKATAEAQANIYKEEVEKSKTAHADVLKQYNDLLGATKDYAELKEFKASTLAKQEEGRKIDFLKAQGCKHPELLINNIDFSKATYDSEKKTFTGLDEVIKGQKEAYPDMFTATGTQTVNVGQQEAASNTGDFANAYFKANPKLARFQNDNN